MGLPTFELVNAWYFYPEALSSVDASTSDSTLRLVSFLREKVKNNSAQCTRHVSDVFVLSDSDSVVVFGISWLLFEGKHLPHERGPYDVIDVAIRM